MALTALEVKSISCPAGRDSIKKHDANGLFLLTKSSGSKLWRLRYKYANKHQEMALGKYPIVSLSEARDLVKRAHLLLAQGVNPMDERREAKKKANSPEKAFEWVAMQWWENQKAGWSEDHAKRIKRWLTKDATEIGHLALDDIDAAHITNLMLSIEAAGSPKKAPMILSIIKRVFAYGLSHRLTSNNPTQGISLRDIIAPLPKVQHRAAITGKKELAALIRDIDQDRSSGYCTIEALRLIPRLFLRPKEIRFLRWENVDLENRIIRIPAQDMKCDREHLVPLAKQVVKHFESIKSVTGYSKFVFPSELDSNKPISKNVLGNRLRTLGYSPDIMSAHGFRSTASTLLHEQGWKHDVVEVQLAHLIGSATARAYNRALYLKKRKKMMQKWADYLDSLK
ncbi:tyrosine-type recombinase/integrase [Agarivorans sp. TSD2052]|uniref:tyrosine-type recombinase/integrase n=1 Tax=Agarivorans sp. TSD2052 TaxID=2937286 RepID=UPI002010C4CD|nr:integrase arm-type DNA-binding domain-containing protein [Agarivorans sp. TSD2052]UPW18089.1 tyrosine-type recombinase/integrase [Agarivorans sp. TSD2052]